MSVVYSLALAGGLFALLAFVHFVVDWVFQSHSEAMVKHNNPKIRAKHCLIYTIGFVPLMYVFGFTFWEWVISVNVLFWSHFYLDTYHGVFLWAKYIRRPPEMIEPHKIVGLDGYVTVTPPDPHKGFVAFIQTALGKILMIAIDQITHLIFLWVIVYFALRHL